MNSAQELDLNGLSPLTTATTLSQNPEIENENVHDEEMTSNMSNNMELESVALDVITTPSNDNGSSNSSSVSTSTSNVLTRSGQYENHQNADSDSSGILNQIHDHQSDSERSASVNDNEADQNTTSAHLESGHKSDNNLPSPSDVESSEEQMTKDGNSLHSEVSHRTESQSKLSNEADCRQDSPRTEEGSKSDMQNVEGASSLACGSPINHPADNSSNSQPQESVYHVKWVTFKSKQVPIITQNENGPCPLLAIMNVLMLQGKVKLPTMLEIVTSGQLMEYLGDCIFENAPKEISDAAQLNYEQNMHDAIAVFHKLQTGLDVNVQFTGVSNFEYTPECIVFDLLGLPLYHGWLVDPDSIAEVAAVGNCSYNQLVEKIIRQKSSGQEELVREALVAEEFLNRTASQLSYHGLCEIAATVNENELCVFFRNNHFSTLHKNKDELLLLVTDQGFLTESNVVWETLSNVEGDGHFVDTEFRTYRKAEASTTPIPPPAVSPGSASQVDQDYLVAMSLQQEQQLEQQHHAQKQQKQPKQEQPATWTPPTSQNTLSDHELALQLQEEENRRAPQQEQQQQQPSSQHTRQQSPKPPQSQQQAGSEKEKKKSSSECIIL